MVNTLGSTSRATRVASHEPAGPPRTPAISQPPRNPASNPTTAATAAATPTPRVNQLGRLRLAAALVPSSPARAPAPLATPGLGRGSGASCSSAGVTGQPYPHRAPGPGDLLPSESHLCQAGPDWRPRRGDQVCPVRNGRESTPSGIRRTAWTRPARGTTGAPTCLSGPGGPCARTTAPGEAPGTTSPTTTPALAPTG